jgi:pantoate--beta-alanine ligase
MMTKDLRLPVEVVGMPTVRETGGLALSSRNKYLAPLDRPAAQALSGALFAAADVFESGSRDAGSLISAADAVLRAYPAVQVEYIELAGAHTAQPVATVDADAFLAIAARVGGVRLIDNVSFDVATGTVDRGIALDRPSILYEEG